MLVSDAPRRRPQKKCPSRIHHEQSAQAWIGEEPVGTRLVVRSLSVKIRYGRFVVAQKPRTGTVLKAEQSLIGTTDIKSARRPRSI
jgi:hypothetical protein